MSQRGGHEDEDDRDAGGEIDLRALGRGLWARKRWIIIPTLIAMALSFVFVTVSSPYYRSTAMVLIENRESAAPNGGAREASLPDEQAVVSQVQLIQSRDLVRQVAKSLDLAKDHEFTSDTLLKSFFSALGLGGSDSSMPYDEKVVDRVAANLNVYPVTGSRVIGIEFVSTSPDTAAKVVNGFVEAYLDLQRDAKRESNRQASQYLADEIAALRGRVADAEERVETFRAKAGLLVGNNNTTVAAQELGDATNQLSTLRTQQAEAQAKADMMRSVLKQGRAVEALDIANSELVRSLTQQRSQLAAQIASESRTLLPQHPRMRELAAQLDGLDEQIKREAEKLARAFENDAKTAGQRVAGLIGQLDGIKKRASSANNEDVQLRALDREARSQRDLLEQMLARYREATARDNPEALLADARVVTRGAAATEPYFPKKFPTIALATIGAFVLSLFGAAAAEVFGARRPEDWEAAPPPSIGAVPVYGRLKDPNRGRVARTEMRSDARAGGPRARPAAEPRAETKPDAKPEAKPSPRPEARREEYPETPVQAEPMPAPRRPLAEEFAKREEPRRPAAAAASIECADAALVSTLARQLADSATDGGALKILTLAATPNLAVTPIVAEIASVISSTGRRVVAVDAGRGAAEQDGPGLSELLTGEATFAQAIHRDPGSRVHLVPGGRIAFDDLDRSTQSRLGVVMEALSLTYDFVMVMAPAGVDGVEAFAEMSSAAVLVSGAGAADIATVEAHRRLRELGVDDVVVLLVDGGKGPGGRAVAA